MNIKLFIVKIILFLLATIGIARVSWSSLRNMQHHGFYRFFAWETILILFLMNVEKWFADPFGLRQIISWSLLIISLLLIYQEVLLFRKKGGLNQKRNEPELVGIEKTTELVTSGVYHYIRHPFYGSLLFLGWGVFFKDISWIGLFLAFLNTLLLVITAKIEEVENIEYFGRSYREYMKHTQMFVPFFF
jgi:protein-S-isoprenylcysteine O-methyltransferase Ste14